MGRMSNISHFRLIVCLLSVAITACMPKVEEDEVVPVVTITSHAINGTSFEPYITLQGACPAGTYMMRVSVNGQEFSVGESQGLTMTAVSGIPVGTCSSGSWWINYPVSNPGVVRTITFKVKAKLNDGRSSLEWATRVVNYVPPSAGVAGFVVAAVGATTNAGVLSGVITLGPDAGDTLTVHSVGGEVAGGDSTSQPGNILTSPFAQLRSALHGVITE